MPGARTNELQLFCEVIMRRSIKVFFAASVAVAGLGIVGCAEKVPMKDAPGGVLSGNDFERNRSTRATPVGGNVVDTTNVAGTTTGQPTSIAPRSAGGGTVTGATGAVGAGAAGTAAAPAAPG